MRLFWAVLTMCELGATWAARADWPKDCVVEADVALRAWQGTFALLAALNASTAAVAAMNQRPRRLVAGAVSTGGPLHPVGGPLNLLQEHKASPFWGRARRSQAARVSSENPYTWKATGEDLKIDQAR